jgi:uncharacterized SAM-binding protein YcdF (DUF218 family)
VKVLGKIFLWCIPALLILLGYSLRQSHTTSFLGLICWVVAVVIFCYLVLWRLLRRFAKLVQVLSTILTILLGIGVVVVSVTGVFIGMAASGEPDAQCQYIVVLGAKVNGTEPSRTLRERIDAAAAYLEANPDTVAVVSGGQGDDEGISEAQCMYNALVERGIDPNRIWMEDQATSTWENLNFSLDLIEAKTGTRPEEIGLLSSEFHLYRGTLFAKECGVQAYGIPAKTGDRVYFINYFLREIAGVWHYYILGG